ncbi:MAG: Fur family transcriptional regulator [Bacteroidota bacterium]|nr:Fur family transcriptional regulator [Bacteroidota bacterium]
MKISSEQLSQKLRDAGMKVTPQRYAILEAVHTMANHPTAEQIIDYIRKTHPGIATGTVYNVLDAMVEKGLVQRVKTDKDAMRYDAVMKKHHHIYCAESERIEDYFDEELDEILKAYFRKKNLPGFEIENIILQIKGNFDD